MGQTARCDKFRPHDGLSWDVDFKLDRPDEFFASLQKKTGIDRSWLEFPPIQSRTGPSAGYVDKNSGFNVLATHISRNGPRVKDSFSVPNPKDIFVRTQSNIENMQVEIAAARFEMSLAMYSKGDPTDAVQVWSVPVFMLIEAVQKMEEVKKIGADVKKEEEKQLILTVLTAVFAVVPFFGELGALAAGLTSLARVMAAVGIVSNLALGVTDAIEHPEMAPVAIVGILLGGLPGGRGARLSTQDMKTMADLRRLITGEIANGLGKTFARNDAILQRLSNVCMRR